MRYLAIVLCCVVLGLGVIGCGGPGPLVGAWELVSTGSDESPADAVPNLTRPVKVLTESRFAFGARTAEGGVTAGGGRYSHDGRKYVERVDYHWIPGMVGLAMTFECRLEGDLWYHKGSFEVGGRRFDIDEVWRRIKE